MLEVVPKKSISVADIKQLRALSALSISDIRRASENGAPICRFEAFSGDWESNRTSLAEIARSYSDSAKCPFIVRASESDQETETLSPQQLVDLLKSLRSIELDTQRATDLEMGFIKDPSEFEPHDDDWI